MLGGIGVWSVTRVFVRQKIRSVAILKCVGASTAQVLATYVLQVALLGAAGSLLGVGARGRGDRGDSRVADRRVRRRCRTGSRCRPSLQGLAVGLLVSLLFALVPLLEVRRVKPLLLLRGGRTAAGPAPAASRTPAGPAAGCAAAWLRSLDWVAGRSATVLVGGGAGRRRVLAGGVAGAPARSVSIGFAGVAVVLHVAALALVRAVRAARVGAAGSRCATRSSACAARATRRA